MGEYLRNQDTAKLTTAKDSKHPRGSTCAAANFEIVNEFRGRFALLPYRQLCSVSHYLPNPSLITGPAKTADMISISSMGLCGGDDFRCR
jgi:hypothetical protein